MDKKFISFILVLFSFLYSWSAVTPIIGGEIVELGDPVSVSTVAIMYKSEENTLRNIIDDNTGRVSLAVSFSGEILGLKVWKTS